MKFNVGDTVRCTTDIWNSVGVKKNDEYVIISTNKRDIGFKNNYFGLNIEGKNGTIPCFEGRNFELVKSVEKVDNVKVEDKGWGL